MECPNCGHQTSAYGQRCRSCGKAIPPGQHLLEASGVVEPALRGAGGPDEDFSDCIAANLGDRMIALAMDSMMLMGAWAVICAWSFLRWGFRSGAEVHVTTASLLVAATLSLATGFAYLWLFEAAFGATLGKLLVGIRVICTGSRGRLAASAIRNALRIIDGIGFYFIGMTVAACSRLHRRLGDLAAGTAVVEDPFPVGIKLLAIVLWAAMLAGSGWLLPRVSRRDISSQPPRHFGRSLVQLSYSEGSSYLNIAGIRISVQFAPAAPREGLASVDSPTN